METRDAIMHNLSKIRSWINDAPDPSEFRTNGDFMKLSVSLMNRCLYLMQVGVALEPSTEVATKGYTRDEAIVVGHMVRLSKLYGGLLVHVAQQEVELAILFFRMIVECAIRTEYLIGLPDMRKSCRSFILSSFGPERDELRDLQHQARERRLTKIEGRILSSIKASLKRAQITEQEIMSSKVRNVDGLSFREMMKRTGYAEWSYAYSFGNASHFVHGDWLDISMHHLTPCGKHYLPNLGFGDPDPRISCPPTKLCLKALARFLNWNRSDPNQVVTPIVNRLIHVNDSIDSAHEQFLGKVPS